MDELKLKFEKWFDEHMYIGNKCIADPATKRRTLCAGCTKELSDDETHVCEECAAMAIAYRDPNGFMTEEDDE